MANFGTERGRAGRLRVTIQGCQATACAASYRGSQRDATWGLRDGARDSSDRAAPAEGLQILQSNRTFDDGEVRKKCRVHYGHYDKGCIERHCRFFLFVAKEVETFPSSWLLFRQETFFNTAAHADVDSATTMAAKYAF